MFLRTARAGYERDGTQVASGWFLALVTRKGAGFEDWKRTSSDVRAVCRYVRMEQCGHFMMGAMRVKGHRITLSGCYGADGLTRDVPEEVWESGVPLPDFLYRAWARGCGHNGAGSEGAAMQMWGMEQFGAKIRASKRVAT